ncbi:hypothetical protein OKW21_005105 [Catalinimonas alkaloidigena]|uniref:hypothetical protein n=1 Tax=Catalinimonas alkaloidigena TaxID=1075417 RepID=UPI002404B482|nr:hypothetical protein [Catalinimonas alkaloidigena]MDF9799842.1 hypothetical protein [Catalinimonas alkaloidigena]
MEVEVSLLGSYGRQSLYEHMMPEELEKGIRLNSSKSLTSGLHLVSIRQENLRMQKLILK